MAEGLDFLIPSSLFMKGALIDNQRSSNKFAASGNRSALRLLGAFRRRGFQPDHFMETSLCGWAHSPRGTSCRPAHAVGGTLTQRVFLQILYLQEINAGYGRKGEGKLAIFHFTVKIVGRSKGKSIIAASASWKVEENRIIKKQNTILKKLQEVFGQVGILLKQWKERLNDIRRK